MKPHNYANLFMELQFRHPNSWPLARGGGGGGGVTSSGMWVVMCVHGYNN